MLAAVARVARAVDVPVTADMEAGYGLDDAELAQPRWRRGRRRAEPRGHATTRTARRSCRPSATRRGSRASRRAADLVLNARIDVHLRGGATEEALERARAYRDAGADCVYPIGVADEATIAAFVALGAAGERPAAARARRRSSGSPSSASPASASATSCTPRWRRRSQSAWKSCPWGIRPPV